MNLEPDEEVGGQQDDPADHQRVPGRRQDIAGEELPGRQGCGQQIPDHALELVVEDREGGVLEGRLAEGEHDDSRRDELDDGKPRGDLAVAPRRQHEDGEKQQAGDRGPAEAAPDHADEALDPSAHQGGETGPVDRAETAGPGRRHGAQAFSR